MEIGSTVYHVYNSKIVGRIVSIEDSQIRVDWQDGRGPLAHEARFISAEPRIEEGPTCHVASSSKNYKSKLFTKDKANQHSVERDGLQQEETAEIAEGD